ncbi:CueP family metal-binding protein [Brevibacterium luteolum]|uniref:CueP family metal-binding protein n=1 Tax=Brevibacterium luteolum TaxID=199591 RepID=UPI00223B51F0|nr:CueP family metal-binding protein [Brevibacterium luteolum]MCT1657081.1 CueP family metal-binding protein [Brevibacterium luteolum]
MDAVEIIDHLDQLEIADRPADLIASVYPDELVLTDNRQEVTLDLPQNLSYLSIAPYVDQTHDCFYHSLTTCQGELSNETIDVQITDSTTGETVVDEQITTFDNGFVGFWVPSDINGTIEISHDGRTGTSDFTTTDDGATCITDLQLA